jgi:hypothetical protein
VSRIVSRTVSDIRTTGRTTGRTSARSTGPSAGPNPGRTAVRALFALAGSALVVGAGLAPAQADDFDGQHLSVNQGAECALRDVGETGTHVLRTGALPKAVNNVSAGPGTDGVKALCEAVPDGR